MNFDPLHQSKVYLVLWSHESTRERRDRNSFQFRGNLVLYWLLHWQEASFPTCWRFSRLGIEPCVKRKKNWRFLKGRNFRFFKKKKKKKKNVPGRARTGDLPRVKRTWYHYTTETSDNENVLLYRFINNNYGERINQSASSEASQERSGHQIISPRCLTSFNFFRPCRELVHTGYWIPSSAQKYRKIAKPGGIWKRRLHSENASNYATREDSIPHKINEGAYRIS